MEGLTAAGVVLCLKGGGGKTIFTYKGANSRPREKRNFKAPNIVCGSCEFDSVGDVSDLTVVLYTGCSFLCIGGCSDSFLLSSWCTKVVLLTLSKLTLTLYESIVLDDSMSALSKLK